MNASLIIVTFGCLAAAAFMWFRRKPAVIRQPHLTFPNDENGDVLREMQRSGDNLDTPRDINFAFAFKTKSDAERFAAEVVAQDYRAEASEYPERKMWQAEITHFMLPTHTDITELEARLSRIAAEYGGEPDGWGSFLQP